MELTLPLLDHALELVVEEQDFDTNVKLVGGLQFHSRHGERSVAVDIDNDLVGLSDLGSDS